MCMYQKAQPQCSPVWWCHALCVPAASPTTAAQINLANLRTNALSNQEGPYDSYSDSRLRNSSMSLDDKSRTMSRSGSFRDGFEEGKPKPSHKWLSTAPNLPLFTVSELLQFMPSSYHKLCIVFCI